MAHLGLFFLGPPEIKLGGHQVSLPTRKAIALLAHLSIDGKGSSRDALATLLWPELDQEHARASLRHTLWALNRAGLGEWLEAVGESISLKGGYDLDVRDFQEKIAQVRSHVHPGETVCQECAAVLIEAITFYRGDFLAGFSLKDSSAFDDWQLYQSESLRHLFAIALEGLVRWHGTVGELDQAQEIARRWVSLDPFHEPAQRALMRVYAQSGKRGLALKHYEKFHQNLVQELGVEPEVESQQLYQELIAGRSTPSASQPVLRGYQLLEKIGEGGAGVIYRAFHPGMGREVAVKIIRPEHANDSEFVRRFEAEAQIIARLENPRIVPLYDFWHGPEGAYLVMRLLRGGNLSTMLAPGPMRLEDAAKMLEQIAEALGAAHRHGIVHRDLKPSNILLDEDGNFYLSDFGMAKNLSVEDQSTQKGMLVGSPWYMAPEQLLGDPVTPSSDIFSLGVVIYEALSGGLPFPEKELMRLIDRQLHEPLPSILGRRPDLPRGMEEVIQKATAKQPGDRFHDVMELSVAFRAALIRLSPTAGINLRGNLSPREYTHELDSVEAYKDTFEVGKEKINAPSSFTPDEARTRAELNVLLGKVKNFWIEGVLKNSIHSAVLIDLGKQIDHEAVRNPWQMVLDLPDQQSKTLADNSRIIDIFQNTNRALLILGAPGSGKTTTLIELARALIDLAESDQYFNQPVPVILNLSSWAKNRPSFNNWIVEELSKKYHIPRRIGNEWLEDNRLILLLDGLDEVEENYRAACIETINHFVETCGLAGIAVCSRIDGYIHMPIQLELYGAIRLLPLSLEQVEEYLTRAGVNARELLRTIETTESLYQLIRTPLMLNILALAYRDSNAEDLFFSDKTLSDVELRKRLFDAFIETMFERKGKYYFLYKIDHVKAWLARLAKQMIKHNQTIFLIEDIQPSWLPTKKQRLLYFLGSRVIGSILLVFGFSIRGLVWGEELITLSLLIGGLLSGMVIGFIDVLHFEQRLNPIRHKMLSPFWGRIIRSILVTIIGGVTLGVFDITSREYFHAILGISFGLVFGLWKDEESISQDIQTVEATGFTWLGALRGMIYGLLAVTFYFLLILVNRQYVLANKPAGILNSVTPLSVGLGGIFGSLVGAMIGAISSSSISIKTYPNQGIRQSLKKAIYPGFLFGFILGLVWAYMEVYYFRETPGIVAYETYDWVFPMVNALLLGSTLFLWFGGFDVIKHFMLRFALRRSDITPGQYIRFLDRASESLILQKVGGGYKFIHHYLMEHFALLGPS